MPISHRELYRELYRELLSPLILAVNRPPRADDCALAVLMPLSHRELLSKIGQELLVAQGPAATASSN